MELLLLAFLAMGTIGAVGVATTKDAEKRGYVKYGEKQTRLIQQTRQVVQETEVIKEWHE